MENQTKLKYHLFAYCCTATTVSGKHTGTNQFMKPDTILTQPSQMLQPRHPSRQTLDNPGTAAALMTALLTTTKTEHQVKS
ncbi:unnamed protein product [Urochloa humidicola]